MHGIFWVAAGATLWGTDTVFRRSLTQTLSPTQIVFFEHCILALVVMPILIRQRSLLSKISLRSWLAIACISTVGSVISTVLFTFAVRDGNPTTAALLQKVQPLFALVLARGMLGERWHRSFPFAVFAALAGAYLISFGSGNLLEPWKSVEWSASLFALAAAAGWGCSTVLGRYVTSQIPFELVTALRFLCALPLLMAIVATEGFIAPPPSTLLPIALIALVPGFAGLMLYYRGLRTTPASYATIAELAFPATAALLNWTVLSVTPASLQIVGLGIVWLSIFHLSRPRHEGLGVFHT
ncbi:MAG: DMT family transporter [Acidobacteria bacterium]|nr:DMT family transporter [Acidobacteriota bacterium]